MEADVTTRTACMQMQLHGGCVTGVGARASQIQEGHLTAKEMAALGNIKAFCARLLKKLAPLLLKEFEGPRGVKTGQDPFTP